MTKLGTSEHIKDVYYRGLQYIFSEIEGDMGWNGLQLLKGYVVSNWEIIQWLIEEELDAN